MGCNTPLTGYKARGGGITFDFNEAYRDLPVQVACGQCIACRIDKASEWTTRILHEAQITDEEGKGSAFVTLTYDKEHLPTDYGLQKSDWQKFAKRLRKQLGPFRYYHCGEYGPSTLRPHYHAIIFGHDFAEDRIPIGKNAQDNTQYLSPKLNEIWGMGQTQLSGVGKSSAAYVAKYCITRENNAERRKLRYLRNANGFAWHVQPEYATMSLKPGIGERWFVKYGGDIYPSDQTIINGKQVRTPRYYDRLLEAREPEQLEKTKKMRAKWHNKADNTEERRRTKEELLKLTQQQKHQI